MGRLPEGAAELAAEVRAAEPGRTRQVVDRERLDVPRVREVLRAQEVAGGGHERHGPCIARRAAGRRRAAVWQGSRVAISPKHRIRIEYCVP